MPRVLKPDRYAVAEAAASLRAGRLVAFPTETVYGLGGIAILDTAVEGIYRAKHRPDFNPLIIHVGSVDAIEPLAIPNATARRLTASLWPGPLTIVLRSKPGSPVVARARGGLESVALRMPSHPTALELLRATGVPVAAPSANPSGRISSTTAAHVAEDFEEALSLVLDGGPSRFGVESTVLDLRDPDRVTLLRPGAIAAETIESILGCSLGRSTEPSQPSSPGQLASHYAPSKPLRLEASTVRPDEALLAFGPDFPTGALVTLNLSTAADLDEAAHHLFAMLRELDRSDATAIAAMSIPATGLGITINDRLRRAAAPRGET